MSNILVQRPAARKALEQMAAGRVASNSLLRANGVKGESRRILACLQTLEPPGYALTVTPQGLRTAYEPMATVSRHRLRADAEGYPRLRPDRKLLAALQRETKLVTSGDKLYRADAYTPAWPTFVVNLVRIGTPLYVYDRSVPRSKAFRINPELNLGELSKEDIDLAPTAEEVLVEWQAVMLVTVAEAYLQDALVFAAERNPSLMKDSEQAAKYDEVMVASSLDEVAAELRSRWARNFLEDGGPRRWKERLERMGARGFGARTH